jgi:coenzyme F420 hydrogenase subunit beta
MVTTMLLYALESDMIDGALVAHMPADGSLTPQPFIARTVEEVLASARSLYCPVPANVAVKEILDTPGRYAVVGIPCHLHGIRKAERISKKLRKRIVLHLGLFCGWGMPFTGTNFVIHRMGLKRSEVKCVAYRGEGWPGGFAVELRCGRKIYQGMHEGWDRNLSAFKVNRCMYCHDHTAELADISFGDAWLPEVTAADTVGTNLMITRSLHGEDVLRQMKGSGRILLAPIERQRVLESQEYCRWKKMGISARIKLARLLGKKVPAYGGLTFPAPSLMSFRDAAVQHFQMVLSSKKSMWWMLRLTSRVIDAAEQKNLFYIPPTEKQRSG